MLIKTRLIVNLTRGDTVCVGELADRPLPRMRGLIGRSALPIGEGLLLSPAPAIHTAFMRFPIDALFLDNEMRVLRIVERLRPWRMASKRGARMVLELSAGECARHGVRVGDRLVVRDRATAPVARPYASESANGSSGAADSDTSAPNIVPRPHWSADETARLKPLHVLVMSHDPQFRSVMSLLLARRNCSVTATANSSRVTQLIAREGADVVVIDASRSSGAATVATVETLARPVGVVLITDDTHPEMSDALTLAKWGPFEDLVAAIELADERRGAWEDAGE